MYHNKRSYRISDLPKKSILCLGIECKRYGAHYLLSITEYIEQKQFYGTVTEATEDLIRVKQKDGTDFTLPPDLSSTKRARQGEYKLRSTGEVVVNPDFLATWNLNRAKED